MNKFEDNLKKIAKQNIDIPKDYENCVKDALNYISNINNLSSKNRTSKQREKRNILKNTLSKIAAIIIIFSVGLTTYAAIGGNLNLQGLGLNKLNKNYEENKMNVNKVIENDYLKLSIENIARDSAYVILEYKLELKEKGVDEIGEIVYSSMHDYSIWLDGNISLNNDNSPFGINRIEKISDTEYSFYQIIYAMSEDNEKIDIKLWYDSLVNNNTGTEIPINEMLEISSELKNVDDNSEKQKQKLSDGTTIILEKIVNTNFQTFARIKRITDNLTWKEYNNSNYLEPNFLVTDYKDNIIPYLTYTGELVGKKYYSSSGEKIDKTKIASIKDDDVIKVVEDYVIIMDEVSANEKIKIIPYRLKMYNDRTNEEKEMYDKAEWYKLEEGTKTYTAKSSLGGTLEINKIEIDDKYITFYYNKNGIVENNIAYVIIRKNNGTMNYIHSTKNDIGNQGTIVFARDQVGTSGLIGYEMDSDEYYNMLKNMEDLEFTLLFGYKNEYEGKPFEAIIPELSNQALKIDDIKQYKTKTAIVNVEYNNDILKYNIDFDKDNNILKLEGYFDLFFYRANNENKSIRPYEYTKVDELINKMKEHMEYKQLKYTIEYQ